MNVNQYQLLNTYREKEQSKGLKPKTVTAKITVIKQYMRYLSEQSLTVFQAESGNVSGFLDCRYNRNNYSPIMYNQAVHHLRSFYVFLQQEETVLLNPVSHLEYEKEQVQTDTTVFTEDEVRRLLTGFPDTVIGIRDRACLELVYSSALRCNEVLSLDVDDIDELDKTVFVRQGKGGRERIVPIGENALLSLTNYLDVRHTLCVDSNRALFLSKSGVRLQATAIQRSCSSMKKKAGIDKPGALHSLRYSCATHLLNNGAPLQMIRQLLGHVKLSTTAQYTRVTDEMLQAQRGKL